MKRLSTWVLALSLFLITIQAAVAPSIDTGTLLHYWPTYNATDRISNQDMLFYGTAAVNNGSCLSDDGCRFLDGDADGLNLSNAAGLSMSDQFISFWVQPFDPLDGSVNMYLFHTRVGASDRFLLNPSGDECVFYMIEGAASFTDYSYNCNAHTSYAWNHVLFASYANGSTALWVDGTQVADGNFDSKLPDIPSNTLSFMLGNRGHAASANEVTGYYDEVSIWNKTPNATDISELYNAGAGCDYECLFPAANLAPTVANYLPYENDHTNGNLDGTVDYQFNVTSAANSANCTLWRNESGQDLWAAATLTNLPNGTWGFNDTTTNNSLVSWHVNCSSGALYAASPYTSFVNDQVNPDWTVHTSNFFATDNSTEIELRRDGVTHLLNTTVSDLYLFYAELYITNSTSDVLYSNASSNLSTAIHHINRTINLSNWNDDNYTVTLYVEDDHTATTIPDYPYSARMDELIYWTPTATITITSTRMEGATPTTTKLDDRYTFSFGNGTPKSTWTFRVESSEPLYYRGDLYPYPVFVTGQQWVDFNTGMPGTIYEVHAENAYVWELEIETEDETGELAFESMGGLNIVNETYTFEIITFTAEANLSSGVTVNGTNLTGSFHFTNGTESVNGSLPLQLFLVPGSNHTFRVGYPGYHNYSTTVNVGNGTDVNAVMGNTYINFYGNNTGVQYYPVCSINGTSLTFVNSLTEVDDGNHTVECTSGAGYPAFEVNITKVAATALNVSFNITEYTLLLTFSSHTSGTISWPYNESQNLSLDGSFQHVKFKGTGGIPDNVMVSVRYNELDSNGTAQYYEFINDVNAQDEANLYVDGGLDYCARVTALTTGNEPVDEAVITFSQTINGTLYIVQQVVTKSIGGSGFIGADVYLNSNDIYTVTVQKSGYTYSEVVKNPLNLESCDSATGTQLFLQPSLTSFNFTWYLMGPTSYYDEDNLTFASNRRTSDTTLWVSTSHDSNREQLTGKTFILYNNTDYLTGNNFDTYLWYRHTNGTFEELRSWRTAYVEREAITPVESALQNDTVSNIIRGFLWALLIILAAFIGGSFKRNEQSTGYYIFAIGCFVITLLQPQFWPVAAVVLLTGVGHMIFSTTQGGA